jgi:phage baseplate assembly protein V
MTVMIERDARGVGNPEVNDSERRHAGAVKFGVVREADYAGARVRVAIGDEDDDDGHVVTGWLPMLGGRARGDTEWHPLEVGERVVVLSESGELQNAVAMPAAIYSNDDPAPGGKAGLWRKKFADDSVIEYDRGSGEFLVDAKSKITLRVGSSFIEITDSSIKLVAGGASIEVGGGGLGGGGGSGGGSGGSNGRVNISSQGNSVISTSPSGVSLNGGAVTIDGNNIHAPGGALVLEFPPE